MAVDRNDGFFDVLDLAFDTFNERSEFLRHGIANCVRDIDGLRACCDHCFHDLKEVGGVCPRGVHRRKLYVIHIGTSVGNHFNGTLECLFARDPVLILQMYVGRRVKGVDAPPRCVLERFPGAVNVFPPRPRKAADHRPFYLCADPFDGLKIAG
jgi:hypothetical protein